MGIRGRVARSTLADTNETRAWRIVADFARVLNASAKPLPIEQHHPVLVPQSVSQAPPDAPAAPGEKDRLHWRSHPCS